MPRFSSTIPLVALLACFGAPMTFAQGEASPNSAQASGKMNCGAHIECVTPDGKTGQVSRLGAPDPGASALIMDDDTVTCLLQAGETDFVIELPSTALLDRFTFLNENADAKGELKIAVANHRLSATSREWTEVEGIVPFAHKRLFGVSLLGIEARFVRLSFHVEKQGRIAVYRPHANSPAQSASALQPVNAFQTSGLDDALSSKFAALHARDAVDLTANATSVGPLSPMPRD